MAPQPPHSSRALVVFLARHKMRVSAARQRLIREGGLAGTADKSRRYRPWRDPPKWIVPLGRGRLSRAGKRTDRRAIHSGLSSDQRMLPGRPERLARRGPRSARAAARRQTPKARAIDRAANATIPAAATRFTPWTRRNPTCPRKAAATMLSRIHQLIDPRHTPSSSIETVGPSGGCGPTIAPTAPIRSSRSIGFRPLKASAVA